MKRIFEVLIIVFTGGSVALAEPPASIDLGAGAVPMISSAVIPIPLEVFAALDKLGNQNWGAQLEKRDFSPSPDRPRTALLFGLAISQGFVAVQAKDAAEVKRVGLAVQRLAGPLGVEKPVEARIKIITEFLHQKDWAGVQQEFDRTRQTVLKTMQNMRDDDFANLVALGGWLGGTGALSSMLKENYSLEASDLLNQAGLLNQLRSEFEKLPDEIKSDIIFSKIDVTLANLGRLMTSAEGKFTVTQVSQIQNETHLLLDAIYEE